jgi:hypothetical protein
MKKTQRTSVFPNIKTSHAASAALVPPQTDRERREELSRLLPLWPAQIEDISLTGRRRIVATLERALRAERKRGHAGHWAYDLSRHAALVKNWKSESAAMRAIEMHTPKQKHPPKGGRF